MVVLLRLEKLIFGMNSNKQLVIAAHVVMGYPKVNAECTFPYEQLIMDGLNAEDTDFLKIQIGPISEIILKGDGTWEYND